jgi:hypothetical protein
LKYSDVKSGRFETEYDISGKFRQDDGEQIGNGGYAQQQPAISLIDLDDHDIPSEMRYLVSLEIIVLTVLVPLQVPIKLIQHCLLLVTLLIS